MRSPETTLLRDTVTILVYVNVVCDVCYMETKLVTDSYLIQPCVVVTAPFSDLPSA